MAAAVKAARQTAGRHERGNTPARGRSPLAIAGLALLLATLLAGLGTSAAGSSRRRSGRQGELVAAPEQQRQEQYPLTPLGQSIKRVVLAGMLPGVCKSHDWRGEVRCLGLHGEKKILGGKPVLVDIQISIHAVTSVEAKGGGGCTCLSFPGVSSYAEQSAPSCLRPNPQVPKYFARFLKVPVINWDARKWRYGRNDGGQSISCRMCRHLDVPIRKQTYRTNCSVIETGGIGKGDLVVVIGTGTPGCPYNPKLRDLPQCTLKPGQKEAFLSLHALDQLWDKKRTLKVHFPVRNLRVLNMPENIFGFDHIIPDNSFFKPMGEKGGLLSGLRRCYRHDKQADLLYVARFQEYKGQLKFLQQADPALLRGFTVHFYGSGGEADYLRRIAETAAARGIAINLHSRVSKQTLMAHSCHAAGQMMWSQFDNNPRAAYEGLYVGMPLFISTTSGVPQPLLEQRFVTPVAWNSDTARFNEQLAGYMGYVRASLTSRRMRRAVVEYTEIALNPNNVYWEICERVGLCAHREQVGGLDDDSEDDSAGAAAAALPGATAFDLKQQAAMDVNIGGMVGEI